MLKPSEVMGVDYLIKAQTSLGVYCQVFRGFDAEDALSQLHAYCDSEAIDLDHHTIEVIPPQRYSPTPASNN